MKLLKNYSHFNTKYNHWFKLPIKYFVGNEGKERDWNGMILNVLRNEIVPKYSDKINLILRVSVDEEAYSSFQSKVLEMARQTYTKGYIQIHSCDEYLDEGETKRVFDICCQGFPSNVCDFIELISTITINQNAKLMDVNFISSAKISSSFNIRTRATVNTIIQDHVIISKSDEGDGVCFSFPDESIFSLNSYTITRELVSRIRVPDIYDDICLRQCLRDECPQYVLIVLSLFFHKDVEKDVLSLIESMREEVEKLLENRRAGKDVDFEPFFREFLKKCKEFVDSNDKARRVIALSSIRL